MTRRDKLLKKIRSNPKAVTFEELRSLRDSALLTMLPGEDILGAL